MLMTLGGSSRRLENRDVRVSNSRRDRGDGTFPFDLCSIAAFESID